MRNRISHRDITFKNLSLYILLKAFRGLRFWTKKCYVPIYDPAPQFSFTHQSFSRKLWVVEEIYRMSKKYVLHRVLQVLFRTFFEILRIGWDKQKHHDFREFFMTFIMKIEFTPIFTTIFVQLFGTTPAEINWFPWVSACHRRNIGLFCKRVQKNIK